MHSVGWDAIPFLLCMQYLFQAHASAEMLNLHVTSTIALCGIFFNRWQRDYVPFYGWFSVVLHNCVEILFLYCFEQSYKGKLGHVTKCPVTENLVFLSLGGSNFKYWYLFQPSQDFMFTYSFSVYDNYIL